MIHAILITNSLLGALFVLSCFGADQPPSRGDQLLTMTVSVLGCWLLFLAWATARMLGYA